MLKGKIAAMDDDGNASILSLHAEGLDQGAPFSTPLKQNQSGLPRYTPKWLQPRCGARFGFGNKIVSFSAGSSVVNINHQSIAPSIGEKYSNFVQSIGSMDMEQFMNKKIQESTNEIDQMEFTVMKCIYKQNYTELLKKFGIDKIKT
jgi:hypothetical protein